MYRDKDRYGQDPTTVLRSKTKFNAPLSWKEPKLIFTCSWSDWFIDEADEWRPEAWDIIKNTPQHTYQILTKRPERILKCLPGDWGNGYDNVWLGVSVESGEQCFRIALLEDIPAKIKFVSAEPLIGDLIDFRNPVRKRLEYNNYDHFLDWIIIGGESGNDEGKYRYRPCEIEWIEKIIEWCKWQEVPVFVKQLGTHLSNELYLKDRHGGNIEEWPERLRVREFPNG